MARAETSQDRQASSQSRTTPVDEPCKHQVTLIEAVPDVEERNARFRVINCRTKAPPPDPPRAHAPALKISPPPPGPYAHLYNGFKARYQTRPPNEAQPSPRPVGAPPTSAGPASVAAPTPAPRAPAGERIETCASSKPKEHRNKKAGGNGIGSRPGPSPPLPWPAVPSPQVIPPPHPRTSSLAHRTQRARHRDDLGPVDRSPRSRVLPPQKVNSRPGSLCDKQRMADELLVWLRTGRLPSWSRGSHHALADFPRTNTVGYASGRTQRGLAAERARSDARYALREGMQHIDTTLAYPPYGDYIPSQVFGRQNEQQMLPPDRSSEQAQRVQHTQCVDIRHAPAQGVPCHNARIPVDVPVAMGPTSVQLASRHQADAHAAADGRVVAATFSSTSRCDPAPPSFYPEQVRSGEQEGVVQAGALPGGPISATGWANTVCNRLGDIPGVARTRGAECDLSGPDRAIACDGPVVSMSLESQPHSESTDPMPPSSYDPNTPAPVEWWCSPVSLPADSIVYLEPPNASYERPQLRVSTYSSLDGAVSGYIDLYTHIS